MSFSNTYTYRQMEHLGKTYFKDKMLLLTSIASGLKTVGNNSKKNKSVKSSNGKQLPSWFKKTNRGNVRIVDLDGPMEDLVPYVGNAQKAINTKPSGR